MENNNENTIPDKIKQLPNNLKPKGELIIIDNDSSNFSSKDKSLQGNFKNFRNYINSMRKKNIQSLEIQKQKLKENIYKLDDLREKFYQSCLDCLGIPYGKLYLEKHPDYEGKLFLDCCGLVRYAFNRISEEFGFKLCNWNQGYQFDILEDEIPFSQLKKGDLIFYSGIYYPDKNMRKQPHNMTHVEVYYGEGEKTIGSRNSDDVVSIFDTFQFMSEKYYNIEYHFKSIEPWLKGIHKSYCKEHKWHEDNTINVQGEKVNKYSAFYDAEDEEVEN